RARLFGAIYGTQQSVIDEMIDDAVAMPVVLLHEQDSDLGQAAIDAVADAEKAVTALGDLAASLARAAGAEEGPPKAAARTQGFAMLDGPFRQWLAHLRPGDAPQDKSAEWQRRAHRIVSRLGDELLRSAGDAAWEGRTTTEQGRTIWLTASHADLIFRRRLNDALPAAAKDEPSPAPPGGGRDRHHLEAAWS
ncbi:MAG: type I-E CRISPR-associated protein Cse1/CasA, partial [Thermobispora sp.]|nr:type I-E CRISPR-associated protein Cse1/CasA [Thermobispora sp.]